jgi:hypothetical protein
VTLCIATYDKRNDQHYDELVSRAAELERILQIQHGSFSDRPKPWLKYAFVRVEHRWPIGLIYAAAASLWTYLFVSALDIDQSWLLKLLSPWLKCLQHSPIWLQKLISLKVIAAVLVIASWKVMRWMEDAREKKQRKAVKSLMMQLVGLHVGPLEAEPTELVNTIAERKKKRILDVATDKAERRVAYHWKGYEQKRNSRAASALLAAVIDLPARWIEDIWSGRR